MVFGANLLTIRNPALGVELSFSGEAALAGCIRDADTPGPTIAPVQVRVASTWQQANSNNPDVQPLHFRHDWTYTTPYMGALVTPGCKGFSVSADAMDMDLLRVRGAVGGALALSLPHARARAPLSVDHAGSGPHPVVH